MDDLRFKHPFSMMVSGPTGSGKTRLVFDFISHFRDTISIDKPVLKVLYCYDIWQKIYETDFGPEVDITFHKGFCYDYADMNPDLMIIDDLMDELSKDKNLTAVFTKTSHHKSISVVFITQNLFVQSKQMRTISLNCHYIILLKNPRDQLQVMMLGRQIFPNNLLFFTQAYEEAVKQPYSHLIIDMTSSCPDNLRLRQRIRSQGHGGYVIFENRG